VRVEKRPNGAAVRYGEKYLPVTMCAPAAKKAAVPPPVQRSNARRQQPQRGSDWNQSFDLKKAPKICQAAQASDLRQGEADCNELP
jgi:hypothetical protein